MAAIDRLRGLVMILMALDHVRDFVAPTNFRPDDPEATTLALFATRWVTHFCAPVFVLLTGVGAWLRQSKVGAGPTARWLLQRGLWLIALEILVVNPLWLATSWRLSGYWFFVQVIWAIGWGLIFLAALVRLRPRIVAIVMGSLIALHHVVDDWWPKTRALRPIWSLLHEGFSWIPLGDATGLRVIYPLIPWIFLLALGWSMGPLLADADASRRDRRLRTIGVAMILAFIALRFANVYGDPSRWSTSGRGLAFTTVSFLACSKYPPSLLYLLMTLGPALLALPALGRLGGGAGRFLEVFGRVPLFYYLAHLALAQLAASLNAWLAGWPIGFWFAARPPGFEPHLGLVYAIWASIVVVLFPVCRAYDRLKSSRRRAWTAWL